eukprot:1195087-Prorocentrum_minimum.AAC.4
MRVRRHLGHHLRGRRAAHLGDADERLGRLLPALGDGVHPGHGAHAQLVERLVQRPHADRRVPRGGRNHKGPARGTRAFYIYKY